jgi:hypothetical protein
MNCTTAFGDARQRVGSQRGQFRSLNMVALATRIDTSGVPLLMRDARLSEGRPQIVVTEFNTFWGTAH